MNENIKIRYAGFFLINKKTFLWLYGITILITTLALFYFYYFPINSSKIHSIVWHWSAENIAMLLLLSLLGIVMEAQFYWNKFTKAQLKIISEQKDIIENHKNELEAQNDEIAAQKEHIEHQKEALERNQIKIEQSISYAQRIQKAILKENDIEKTEKLQSGLFFLPRDKVSGDFYWSYEANQKLYVALADCTGHGIPGAFLAMFGFAALDNIAREYPSNSAAELLDNLKVQIVSAMHQNLSSDRKEGMDIAILIFDFEHNTVNFAGANEELIKISKTSNEIIKGDRMPVAFHKIENKSYKNHYINFSSGDLFYLYTDGFIDQIGGAHERKYMRQNFREFINLHFQKSVEEQVLLLKNEFYRYKNDLPQVDDVSVMIIKVK
jgi:serine phosphatase RsbU (regulator of sigma subunit)